MAGSAFNFVQFALLMCCISGSLSNILITYKTPDKELCNIQSNQTLLEKNITIIPAKNEKMITGSFQIEDPDHTTAEVYICQRGNNSLPASKECLRKTPLKQIQTIRVNTTYMVTAELPKSWNCTKCIVQWILKQEATEMYPVSREYVKCYPMTYAMSDKPIPDMPFIPPSNGSAFPMAMNYPMHHIPYAPYLYNYRWCGGYGWYSHVPGITHWCGANCVGGYCPGTHCSCSGHCNVHTGFNYVPGMNFWCNNNCHWGYCPASHCNCLHALSMPTSEQAAARAPAGPSQANPSTKESSDSDMSQEADIFKEWYDQRKAQQERLKRQRLYVIQMYFK
ncbi:uncharacterized protein LOC115219204 [Argonauta hians]